MDTRTARYDLVRVVDGGNFRTVGVITDPDEAAFLQRVLTERCAGRVYLLRPVQHPQRRAE